MTLFDGIVIAVLIISGGLAFLRGFINEVLSILAWVIGAVAALALSHYATPMFREFIGTEWLATVTAAVAVFLAIFVRIEAKHPDPIVDLKFFRNSIFVNALTNNFVVFMGLMGGIFLIPVFAQTFLGYNATESGYLFVPMAVALTTVMSMLFNSLNFSRASG